MKRMLMMVLLAGLALGAMAVDTSIAYQGVLKGANGESLADRNKVIEFRLYTVPTGGEAIWGRSYALLLDEKGLFNAELTDAQGSQLVDSTLTAALKKAQGASTLYVGLTVRGSSGEIAPRQKILMVPYASYAADVNRASGDMEVAGLMKVNSLQCLKTVTAESATVEKDFVLGGNLTLSASSGRIQAQTVDAVNGRGIIPVGGIILWSGQPGAIPSGWALCDGNNGTPDLRGRFVVGYNGNDGDYNAVGKTGGEKAHALSVAEMPNHSHSVSVKTAGYAAAYNGSSEVTTAPNNGKNNGGQSFGSNSSGSGWAHENRPPYYVLCYIMRTR